MEEICYIMAIAYGILLFIILVEYVFGDIKDFELEIKRLKKIIKKQNKEIKKLKNLGGYIYDNYMKKEND